MHRAREQPGNLELDFSGLGACLEFTAYTKLVYDVRNLEKLFCDYGFGNERIFSLNKQRERIYHFLF